VTPLVERLRIWRHTSAFAEWRSLWSVLRPAWRTALWIGSGGRGFTHVVNGTDRFRIDARQAPHAAAIEWEPEQYAAVMAEIRPGAHVLDVGAFNGLYALGAAMRVGNAGRVVAVEASPRTAHRLRSNVRANALERVITVVEAVCADRAGQRLVFHTSDDGSMIDSAVGGGPGSSALELPTTTIDRMVGELGLKPSVIKIDVEGYEDLVICGAAETLERFHPTVFVELHPAQLATRGIAVSHIAELLASYGLTCSDPGATDPNLPPGTLLGFKPAAPPSTDENRR
jgi:FkbM family methyltransferase